MNDKLKQIIFKKLYSDLSRVEIILHDDGSIWFIDREKKYWYLEFEKSGKLWWRYEFFSDFFTLFSLQRSEYVSIITEWVEEVLNRKAVSTTFTKYPSLIAVEEVLNRKAVSTLWFNNSFLDKVEEVLNRKAVSTNTDYQSWDISVEEVLNRKAVSTQIRHIHVPAWVEEVLNRKVVSTDFVDFYANNQVEEVLKQNAIINQ